MLLSEYRKPTRTGCAPCAQAAAGTSSSARSAALRSFSSGIGGRRGLRIFGVGDVDDLAAGEAISRSQPLAIARPGLAGELVGGDRLSLLDDDFLHAAGVGLDHRDLA